MSEENYSLQKPNLGSKIKWFISSMPYAWLLSSILFLLITSVVAPMFWPQMDNKAVTGLTAINWIFGIAGILIYFSEPIIWHINLLTQEINSKKESKSAGENKEPFMDLLVYIGEIILLLIVMLPGIVIFMFKPVLRAMILYTSLSFLGSLKEGTNLYTLFSIVVTLDILMYYLEMAAPDWKYNPMNLIFRKIKLKNIMAAKIAANMLLIIHTALIYSLLLSVVYYDMYKHPANLNLKNLTLWWLILTIYNRMSFVSGNIKEAVSIENTSKRILLVNFLALIIFYIAFIWPFYFG